MREVYKTIKIKLPKGYVPYKLKDWTIEVSNGGSYIELECIEESFQKLLEEIVKRKS